MIKKYLLSERFPTRYSPIIKSIKNILPFILLFVFTILFRINFINLPYERDEGEYAYTAYFTRQGVVPYRDIFDQKPPLIFLIFYFSEILNPGGTWGPRVLSLISAYAVAVLLFLTGKELFDTRTGLVSMWLFIAMLTIPEMTPFAANTEIFMLPFVMGCFFIFVCYKNSNKKLPWYLFGAFSSIAVMFKPICIPLLLYIFITWIYNYATNNHNFKSLLINILLTAFGIVTVISPIFLYLVKNNALKSFFDTVIIYNLSYFQEFHNNGLKRFVYIIPIIIATFPLIFLSTFILILSKRHNSWYFAGILFFLFLPIYNSPSLHYYLIIIPFIALFASAGFNYLLIRYTINHNATRAYLTFLFILSAILMNLNSIFSSNEELLQQTYHNNQFFNSVLFAKMLTKFTKTEDEILMLGNEPQVLYYSKRKSASRFFYMYPMFIPTAKTKIYQDEYINDLTTKVPKFIVFTPYIYPDNRGNNEAIVFLKKTDAIIHEKYDAVGGCKAEEGCGWTEDINKNNMDQFSFILFRKKT